MTDQGKAFRKGQVVYDGVQVVAEPFEVVASLWVVALAMPPQVGSDDPVAGAERGDLVLPGLRAAGEAVLQDQGLTGAARPHVDHAEPAARMVGQRHGDAIEVEVELEDAAL